ncbi:hypothetical protein Tco_0300448 [Tanacetum coccineum]
MHLKPKMKYGKIHGYKDKVGCWYMSSSKLSKLYMRRNYTLSDPGIVEGQAIQTVITHNAAYQADDLDVHDSDYALAENSANVVTHSETEINSDSNNIPYSQYVIESQQALFIILTLLH